MSSKSGELLQTKVQILDKEYVVGCRAEEQDSLITSAHMLDRKMREIRSSGKVVGTERVAVMAALNIAYELLEEKNREHSYNEHMGKRLQAIQDKIESALLRDGTRVGDADAGEGGEGATPEVESAKD